jgi:hypothetical protein
MTNPNELTTDEQWDGTDIEPGHPRNNPERLEKDSDQEYFDRYSQGDKFS